MGTILLSLLLQTRRGSVLVRAKATNQVLSCVCSNLLHKKWQRNQHLNLPVYTVPLFYTMTTSISPMKRSTNLSLLLKSMWNHSGQDYLPKLQGRNIGDLICNVGSAPAAGAAPAGDAAAAGGAE